MSISSLATARVSPRRPSWIMLWFVLLRFPNKVVVTAPTSGQLFDALFAELKRWINELPAQLKVLLTVKSDRVELNGCPE